MKRLIIILFLAIFMTGCAQSITRLTENYKSSSDALKEFARISADDWLFGSGIIQGALDDERLPAWVFKELREIDAWFQDKDGNIIEKELNTFQLGMIIGKRFRMAGPVVRAALEQYTPNLLNIKEVITVLSFLGI